MQRKLQTAVPFGLSALLGVSLFGCATAEPEVKAPPPPAAPELDPQALCDAVADVEDARARGEIAAARNRFDERARVAPKDRVAAFASLYAIPDDQKRWKAFRADGERHQESAVAPLGECFTYADWKMADKAEAPCARAAERSDGLVLVDIARADLLLNQGEPGKARGYLEAALAAVPGCVPALTRLGELARADGDVEGALGAWDHALEARPACFSCAASKAKLIEKEQGADAAIAAWEAALAIAPDHAPTVKRFAAAEAGRDPEKAFAAYERAISLGVKDFATLLAAARLAEQLGDDEKALAHAQAASAVQADDVVAWRLIAALAEKQGKQEDTVAAAEQVLRLSPGDVTAHLTLARLDKAADKWVEALTHYEQAARSEASPDDAPAEQREAAGKELEEVLATLMVAKKGATGPVNRVVGAVQRDVRKLFEARLKQNRGMSGVVEVTVVTDAEGAVQEVEVASDTLGDAQVVAALVGGLRRAKITGGAKRYSFELEFK